MYDIDFTKDKAHFRLAGMGASPLGTEHLLLKTTNTKRGKKRLPWHLRKILCTFSATQNTGLTSPSSESSPG